MRLLQVAKRPEIVGGGIGCAWSVCQALPDWSHAVFCCWNGAVPQRTRDAFGGHRLLAGRALTAELLREIAPDAILLHNSSDHDLPPELAALSGVDPGTVRLSIGLEDPQDLIADIEQALRHSA